MCSKVIGGSRRGQPLDVYDPDSTTMVEEGAFIYEPPYGHHYDVAKDEEVVVQIMGMGPVETTFLTVNNVKFLSLFLSILYLSKPG